MTVPRWECYRKRAYESEKIARREARIVAAKAGQPMHAYACPHCGQWHIAHDRPQALDR